MWAVCTHAHARTRTHAHARTRTHTHAHARTQTQLGLHEQSPWPTQPTILKGHLTHKCVPGPFVFLTRGWLQGRARTWRLGSCWLCQTEDGRETAWGRHGRRAEVPLRLLRAPQLRQGPWRPFLALPFLAGALQVLSGCIGVLIQTCGAVVLLGAPGWSSLALTLKEPGTDPNPRWKFWAKRT